jgi:hypothetical protein
MAKRHKNVEHWHPKDGGIPEGTIRTKDASQEYCEGWDRIFGKKPTKDQERDGN